MCTPPPVPGPAMQRSARVDSSTGTSGRRVVGLIGNRSVPSGAGGRPGGPSGSGQHPVSSRYSIAPRPRISSRDPLDAGGPGKAIRACRSVVTRIRSGWSQPRTRPALWAASTAPARATSTLAAIGGGSGPPSKRSTRAHPGVHSATITATVGPLGPSPRTASSASSIRAAPAVSSRAERNARATAVRVSVSSAGCCGAAINKVSATSRSSIRSRPCHRRAAQRSSRPNSASKRYRPRPRTHPGVGHGGWDRGGTIPADSLTVMSLSLVRSGQRDSSGHLGPSGHLGSYGQLSSLRLPRAS